MNRVKLESCILGKNTQVGSKAELTRCITQAGYEINAGGESSFSHNFSQIKFDFIAVVKGEKLELSDWTANPEDDSSLNRDT
jgi:translation initiation factor eIF-2B subunit gamma